MAASDKDWIEIGVIARAHGVGGWLRVRTLDPASTVLGEVEEVALGEAASRRLAVRSAVTDATGWRVRLDGIDDRDAAEALRGLPVWVAREALPELDDGELYVADLVGCTVVDAAGATLGVVRSVYHSGAHETLVVARPAGVDAEIPLVDGIVTDVDLDARRIACDPPEGLLDVNEPRPKGGA